MMSSIKRPERERSDRPSAETTPAVTVHSSPNGLPSAIASCPGRIERASPKTAGIRSLPAMRNTARSVSGSSPATDAAEAAAVEQRDLDLVGAVHDVRVGEDEAVGGGDEAGAAAGAAAAAADVDADDRGAGALDRAGDDARIAVDIEFFGDGDDVQGHGAHFKHRNHARQVAW